MTNETDTSQMNDWNKLAREALDLWEGHLNALASDPVAKEEMAKFIAPMSHMFEQWSTMMQSGLHNCTPSDSATAPVPETAAPSFVAPEASAPSCVQETAEAEEEPYTVWEEEMIKAAQAAAESVASTYEIAAHTHGEDAPVIAVAEPAVSEVTPAQESSMTAAYAALVDVADAAVPAYGSTTGASFVALQEAMPDYYKDLIHAGSASVADAYRQQAEESVATKPVVADVASATVSVSSPAPTGGSAPSSSGSRDLAELASRLAQLERELDGLRATGKSGVADAALDDLDDADALRMARARQG